MQVVNVYIISLESAGISLRSVNFYTHILQQFNQQVYIKNIGNITDGYRFGG